MNNSKLNPKEDISGLSERIRHLAEKTGIDAIGFTDASAYNDYPLNHPKRRDPGSALPGAKSVIVAGMYIGGLTLPFWSNALYGRTSRLYLSGFFCDVVKPLEPLAAFLRSKGYKAVVCDSSENERSIIPLKLAAVRAGLGWQGKHSLLISRTFGTFLALGGILTDAPLEINTVEEPDRCGACNRCREFCPLDALHQPYVLEKTSCISYLLQVEDGIQKVRHVSENRVMDCEICQEVCPWNKKHMDRPLNTRLTRSFQKKIRDLEDIFYLPNLVEMTEAEYHHELGFLNTGIPYHIFHRNVLMAMKGQKNNLMNLE